MLFAEASHLFSKIYTSINFHVILGSDDYGVDDDEDELMLSHASSHCTKRRISSVSTAGSRLVMCCHACFMCRLSVCTASCTAVNLHRVPNKTWPLFDCPYHHNA